ncbi:MAG: TPM domain-containing protein [Phascolarctobacterium sp.]|nr:TPM domain-containing protein [Phascolarctobacterium sp.]
MKKFFYVLTFLLALLTNVALAAMPSLVDNANTLQPAEKQRVAQMLQSVEKKHNIRCAVVTVKSTGNVVPGQYANKILDTYYTDGQKGNIVLLMDMSKRKWYVSTDKPKMDSMLDNEFAINHIEENMLPSLKSNKFADGYIQYAKTVDELVSYYEKNGEPMQKSNWLMSLLGAIVSGIASAFGYRGTLRASMSNVEKATSAAGYLQDFVVSQSSDNFMYTTYRRVPIPTSSGSRDSSTDSGHGGGGGSF